jgi:hypothetical protein
LASSTNSNRKIGGVDVDVCKKSKAGELRKWRGRLKAKAARKELRRHCNRNTNEGIQTIAEQTGYRARSNKRDESEGFEDGEDVER